MDWLVPIEILSYLLFFVVLVHSYKRNKVSLLLSALSFGLVLEYISILAFNAYSYARFLVMIGPVPLWIAVGWAILIYCAYSTSEQLRLPDKIKPLFDSLLLLLFDLAMDPTASTRLGYWNWGSFQDNWFGVPSANFFGWFVAIAAFFFFYRFFEKKFGEEVAATATPPIAVMVLVTLSAVWLYAVPLSLRWFILELLLTVSIITIIWSAKHVRTNERFDVTIFLVPFIFLAFFVSAAILTNSNEITPYAIVLLIISSSLYLLPSASRLFKSYKKSRLPPKSNKPRI